MDGKSKGAMRSRNVSKCFTRKRWPCRGPYRKKSTRCIRNSTFDIATTQHIPTRFEILSKVRARHLTFATVISADAIFNDAMQLETASYASSSKICIYVCKKIAIYIYIYLYVYPIDISRDRFDIRWLDYIYIYMYIGYRIWITLT